MQVDIKPHARCDHEYHKSMFIHKALKAMTYSDLSIARKALHNGAYYRRTKTLVLLPRDLALLEEVLEEKIIDMIVKDK